MQGREESLNAFAHLLMFHYAAREIRSRVTEIVPAILKSVKAGQSEKETVLALKGTSRLLGESGREVEEY